ncbi:MAG: hypothetical protein ASARMPREDX12_004981 [Alectoria sarmentosa]|nr:MAG: hypothetical protein ASARMPRED_003642 [Alectoria sarmentosa]CAD6572165.1 MAG: hypothetical protein ASARMPREDX12_004981 [Alectoria sarmentosa]
MLTLKNEYSSFSRKADAKIKLLKDVLDSVQRGENVDVEKVLGTGDEEQEQEWRDVLRNIEEQGRLWQAKDRKGDKKRLQKEQEAELDGAQKVAERGAASDTGPGNLKSTSNDAKRSPGFY